jgi:hypothetical protein
MRRREFIMVLGSASDSLAKLFKPGADRRC